MATPSPSSSTLYTNSDGSAATEDTWARPTLSPTGVRKLFVSPTPIEEQQYRQLWSIKCQYTGKYFTPNCDVGDQPKWSPRDFFMASFPSEQLTAMVEHTSTQLQMKRKEGTTLTELLLWFGVTILITRFEFAQYDSLWDTATLNHYIPAPDFGRTGMSRARYGELLTCMVWSVKCAVRPSQYSVEEWGWQMVDGFLDTFNDHRKRYYSHSPCAEESMIWSGKNDDWKIVGPPEGDAHYMIKLWCDRNSGTMIRLKHIKLADQQTEKDMAICVSATANSKMEQHTSMMEVALSLERKLCTTLWHRRLNLKLFAVCVVDAFILAKGCQGSKRWQSEDSFFRALAEDLIITHSNLPQKKRQASSDCFGQDSVVPPIRWQTPTKRRKPSNPTHRSSGACIVCRKGVTYVCRLCQTLQPNLQKTQFWICGKVSGNACMSFHNNDCHHQGA